jgi:thymidine phosphorylase
MIAGRAKDFDEGIELANQFIDSGEAFKKLERVIKFTNTERRFLRNLSEVEMEKSPGGLLQES